MNKSLRGRRITVTLEPDVADAIRVRLQASPQLTKKTLINQMLRRGFEQDAPLPFEPLPFEKFVIKPFQTEFAPGITPEKMIDLLKEI